LIEYVFVAMILLEAGNRILGETVAEKIKNESKEKREPVDVRLCDFDDVMYRVVIDAATRNIMQVSIALPCWPAIKSAGGQDALDTHYKGLSIDPIQGYDITLQIDLDNLPVPAAELTQKLTMLKANLIGGVFYRFFNNLVKGGAALEPFHFDLRSDTKIYILPASDRVTVIFSIDFYDRFDTSIAKVFLQEFVESRRHLGNAPPCNFGLNPPLEMKNWGITEPQGKLGFISFALMKNHVDGAKLDRAVWSLQSFRNYVQYHIKCSKAYFHSRMRARVRNLLKVLNRAKTDQDESAPKKTITGRTFVRK